MFLFIIDYYYSECVWYLSARLTLYLYFYYAYGQLVYFAFKEITGPLPEKRVQKIPQPSCTHNSYSCDFNGGIFICIVNERALFVKWLYLRFYKAFVNQERFSRKVCITRIMENIKIKTLLKYVSSRITLIFIDNAFVAFVIDSIKIAKYCVVMPPLG